MHVKAMFFKVEILISMFENPQTPSEGNPEKSKNDAQLMQYKLIHTDSKTRKTCKTNEHTIIKQKNTKQLTKCNTCKNMY